MKKLSFLSTTTSANQSFSSNTSFFFPPRNIFFPKWTRNVVTSATLQSPTTSSTVQQQRRRPKKIVVIMGATGCGKSKLSIDLAARFFPSAEVINSDKIQVYDGLDITTNKISMPERCGVPHHLLGEFKPTESHPEFSPSDFRAAAGYRINEIVNRGKIPFIVGGSNSFIYALLVKRFNSGVDIFESSNPVSKELRYQCCFIWVDVMAPVLNLYLDKRVDEMLESAMFEELEEYFEKEGFSDSGSGGIRKAIGVPEFERYFKGDRSYEEAAMEIKENTRVLAERQVGKIMRLKEAGWNLQRVDATLTLTAKMVTSESGGKTPTGQIWEKQVLEPSAKIVKKFLLDQLSKSAGSLKSTS